MSDIPTLYQGEGILLAWADTSSRGRTVTFMLEDSKDADAVHPFKGINYGKTGQRVGIVVVALREDEHPAEQPKPEKPKQRWDDLTRAQQSGILCADPKFQQWIGMDSEASAAEWVRQWFMISTRQSLNLRQHENKWLDLVSRYRQATGQEAVRYD